MGCAGPDSGGGEPCCGCCATWCRRCGSAADECRISNVERPLARRGALESGFRGRCNTLCSRGIRGDM